MSKKIKKIIVGFAAISILCTPITTMASDVRISNNNYEVSPRADMFEWRFKKINGKLYMRLYNCKTGKYVGEWILV